MKKVVELYKGLLPAMGLTVGANDQIFIGGAEWGNIAPVTIGDKHVYLPTDEFLRNSDYRDQIAFHPLAEDVLKKRSPVLTAIQNAFNVRLYSSGVMLIDALLNACIKQKNGEDISNPRLLSYISGNEACDEKVRSFFTKLSEVIKQDHSKKLFNVYLRHGNEGTEGHSRQCVISSPLVTELERVASIGSTKPGGLTVWGVESPRKKDVEILANLIKTVFPGIENRSYSTGSNDKIAPYCDALFQALKPINEDIIEASKALAKVEPVTSLIEYLCIDLTPVDEVLALKDDYDILRNSIVKTAYNDGDGWNTEIRKPQHGDRPETNLPSRQSNDRGRERGEPEKREAEAAVAITKEIIVNSIKPIPGTRQPLVSNISEEDYRTVQRKPRRPTDRNADYRGRDPEYREERRSSRRRPSARDFRSIREVEDEIRHLTRELKDLEYNRDYDGADEVKEDLLDLRDILRDLEDEEYRGRRSGGGRDRGRDYDDRRSSRPRPRALDQDDRRRDRGRDSSDRFGRRR